MAILSCPVCKWPDGPGCEMCEQGGPLDAATSGCAYAGDLPLSATELLKKRPDITWHPIAELPEELKDGRPVLFHWAHANMGENVEDAYGVVVWDKDENRWLENGTGVGDLYTHFSRITGPEG